MSSESDRAGKVPPSNLDAEKSVIACVCLAPHIIDDLSELRSEHFYSSRNGMIWSAILDMNSRRIPSDAVTLAEELNRRGHFEEIGGQDYLVEVMESVPNSAHSKYYAEIVLSKWRSRQAVYGCTETLELIYDGASDDDVATKASGVLSAITERTCQPSDVSIGDVMIEAWDEIHSRIGRHEAAGTPTGFVGLDSLIVGIQPTELVIVAARPAIGKSSFAGCWAWSLAKRGIGVLFLSLEMSKLEISERMLCLDSGVSGSKLKAGTVDEIEIDRLMLSAGRLGKLPIRIDEQPGQKVRAISATARRAKRLHDIKFVIVDYLQLIEPDRAKDVREQEVASITKALKGLAKELSIPFIVLAQLNRAVETRVDKTPKLSDLRESGAIEQDADKVFFLHRPAAYDPVDRPGECDVIVAKNRCGPTGIVTLAWLADRTQFADIEFRHRETAEVAAKLFGPPSWVG